MLQADGILTIVNYPQDAKSCQLMLKNADKITYWGLLVVVAGEVVEVQRWNETERLECSPGPEGKLMDFEAGPQGLKFYLKDQLAEWNLETGELSTRPYKDFDEAARGRPFHPVRGPTSVPRSWLLVRGCHRWRYQSPTAIEAFWHSQREMAGPPGRPTNGPGWRTGGR